MKFSVLLGSALHSLKGNARRTILTMLGIIIGIAAVITIMSLGKGVQKMAVSAVAAENHDFFKAVAGDLAQQHFQHLVQQPGGKVDGARKA